MISYALQVTGCVGDRKVSYKPVGSLVLLPVRSQAVMAWWRQSTCSVQSSKSRDQQSTPVRHQEDAGFPVNKELSRLWVCRHVSPGKGTVAATEKSPDSYYAVSGRMPHHTPNYECDRQGSEAASSCGFISLASFGKEAVNARTVNAKSSIPPLLSSDSGNWGGIEGEVGRGPKTSQQITTNPYLAAATITQEECKAIGFLVPKT